jgi:hypothetical protein
LKLLDEQIISAGEDVEPLLKDLEEGDSDDEQLLESLRQASGKYCARRSKSAAGGGPIVRHPRAVNALSFCGSSQAPRVASAS